MAKRSACWYDRHRDRVSCHAYRLTGNHHDAEDILASAFLKLWRRRNAVRMVEGRLFRGCSSRRRTWLATAGGPRAGTGGSLSPCPAREHLRCLGGGLLRTSRPGCRWRSLLGNRLGPRWRGRHLYWMQQAIGLPSLRGTLHRSLRSFWRPRIRSRRRLLHHAYDNLVRDVKWTKRCIQ